MAQTIDIPAWIALFMGLYSLTAAIGEWRSPGTWAAMLSDFERSAGLRFLTGLFLLSLGAAIYMVNPWRPGDWLAVAVSVLGGIITLEGALILAMGDRFLRIARLLLGRASRAWAAVSAIIGIALIVIATLRF